MQVMEDIEDLDEGALLDRLDFLHATERRTQAESASGCSSNPSPASTSGAIPTAPLYLVDHTGTRRIGRAA